MIALLLSAWLLLAGGFRDGITCTFQGFVYVMPDAHPDFGAPNGCTGIRWRIDRANRALILWSPHTVVTIPLPLRTDGWALVQYIWGHERAQIGGKPHRIHAEPTLTG